MCSCPHAYIYKSCMHTLYYCMHSYLHSCIYDKFQRGSTYKSDTLAYFYLNFILLQALVIQLPMTINICMQLQDIRPPLLHGGRGLHACKVAIYMCRFLTLHGGPHIATRLYRIFGLLQTCNDLCMVPLVHVHQEILALYS